MMLRPMDLLMIGVLLASVVWTFKVKHDSQVALDRVKDLERQIAAERTEIDLLKSDWSLLTNPARLQALAERHGEELNLSPMQPGQILREGELLPFRRQAEEGVSPMFENRTEADKAIITGSTKRPESNGGAQ